MAASRKKRAKAVNTSPSTTLVVFLVFFILLSMGLGVWGYYSNQSADNKEKTGKTIADKGKVDNDLKQWYGLQSVLAKSATGQALSADERGDLAAGLSDLNGKFGSKPNRAEVEKMIEKFKSDLGWNDKEKAFVTNYAKLNGDLKAEVQKLQDANKKMDDEMRLVQGRESKRDEEVKASVKKLDDLIASANKDTLDERAKATKEFAEANEAKKQALVDLDKRVAEIKASYDSAEKKFREMMKDRDEKIAVLVAKTAKYKKEEEKTAKADLLSYDVPKGKIVRLDWSGKMPYINLGSADGVKEQLTFSVFGRSPGVKELKDDQNPKATYWQYEKEIKGSLEVVKVIDAHLAQARVTYMRDMSGDPLEPGDQVFNPAWNPNQKTHVAIAGLVDFTGQDSTTVIDQMRALKEFINNLERQNIIVDAYLNLRNLKVEGQMTLNTDYLIRGESPQIDSSRVVDAKDEKVTSKTNVSVAMEAMRKELTAETSPESTATATSPRTGRRSNREVAMAEGLNGTASTIGRPMKSLAAPSSDERPGRPPSPSCVPSNAKAQGAGLRLAPR